MRKLTQQDRQRVLDYVSREPEYNLFILGDVESFGFGHPDLEVFAQERGTHWNCLLLRYLDNYVLCSADGAFDREEVARRLEAAPFNVLSGKSEVVDTMAPFFPQRRLRRTYLARLGSFPQWDQPLPPKVHLSQLGPEHAPDMVGLYLQIDEFAPIYRGREEQAVQEIRMNLLGGGRSFGAFSGGKLAAVASTTAEASIGAMVGGVATLPGFRRQGLASSLIARLCTYCLSEGMEFLCLFYDNPAAGRIYRRLGFEEIGRYTMLEKADPR